MSIISEKLDSSMHNSAYECLESNQKVVNNAKLSRGNSDSIHELDEENNSSASSSISEDIPKDNGKMLVEQ